MTLAGYVGGEPHWEVFEEQWAAVLDRFEVPYFHMKEFGDPNGVYQKWLPAKDHYEEIKVFMAGLARAIGRSQLKGFGSILRLNDLDRFNAEKRSVARAASTSRLREYGLDRQRKPQKRDQSDFRQNGANLLKAEKGKELRR